MCVGPSSQWRGFARRYASMRASFVPARNGHWAGIGPPMRAKGCGNACGPIRATWSGRAGAAAIIGNQVQVRCKCGLQATLQAGAVHVGTTAAAPATHRTALRAQRNCTEKCRCKCKCRCVALRAATDAPKFPVYSLQFLPTPQ